MSKTFFTGVIALILYGLCTLFFLQLYNMQKLSIRSDIAGFNLKGLEFSSTPAQDGWIRNLYVSREPLILGFTPDTPLELLHDKEVIYSLAPLSYKKEGANLRIDFDHSVSLVLGYTEDNQRLTLLVDLPEMVPSITSVKIPAGFAGQFTYEINSYLSLPVLVSEDIVFFLTYSDNSFYDSDDGYLYLVNNKEQGLGLEIGLPFSDKSLFQSWFSSIADLVSTEEYENDLAVYEQSLFNMWSSSLPDKDSPSIASFLSMAVDRGAYGENLSLVKEKIRRSKWPFSLGVIPFMGLSSFEENNLTSLSDTEEAIQSSFRKKDYLFLLSNYDARLLWSVLGRTSLSSLCRNSTAYFDMSPDILVNYLNTASLVWPEGKDVPESVSTFMNKAVEDVFIPLMVNTTEGMFMESEQGWADTLLSLKTGTALVNCREFWNDEFYLPAGMQLVLSVLQENPGKIPLRLSLKGREIMNREGTLSDSVIVEILFPDRPYNNRLSYETVKGLGSTYWSLSSGKLKYTRKTYRRLDFSSTFALSGSEYIILGNMPRVSSVYLHDIKWKADAAWDDYKEGWYYDRKNRMLYLKIYHQSDSEKIRIDFYRKPVTVKKAAPEQPQVPDDKKSAPVPEVVEPEPVPEVTASEDVKPEVPQSVNRRLRFQ